MINRTITSRSAGGRSVPRIRAGARGRRCWCFGTTRTSAGFRRSNVVPELQLVVDREFAARLLPMLARAHEAALSRREAPTVPRLALVVECLPMASFDTTNWSLAVGAHGFRELRIQARDATTRELLRNDSRLEWSSRGTTVELTGNPRGLVALGHAVKCAMFSCEDDFPTLGWTNVSFDPSPHRVARHRRSRIWVWGMLEPRRGRARMAPAP